MGPMQFPTVGFKAQYDISDPGNGGVIDTIIQNGVCGLTTLTAETRTVKDPTKSGIRLTICMIADGGDCVVTFATAINQAGQTVATFSDVNDKLTIESIPNGTSGCKWSVVANDGVDGIVFSRSSYTKQIGTRAKVGATSGWTVGAANNLGTIATMAASQTAGTLVIPIDGLHIGDSITGFKIIGQIESGGNAVTVDADLRALTNVAADPTDASIGTMTQVSVTADTAMAQEKTGLAEVVTSGKTYYLLVTGTTLGSTDIQLLACELTVTTK